ncbi:hypothetical protein [Pseudomonas sp. CLCA07]
MKTPIFLRAVKSMITKILVALSLVAMPFHSMAHDEYSIGSAEIEIYEIELSPNEKLKLSYLKIYSENEFHEEEEATNDYRSSPPQNTANERQDFSLIPL